MKINKYFFVNLFMIYTLMGYIPALMIKVTPLSGTILEDTIDYILRNFIHNWEFKIIVALSIVIIGSIIINKEWAFRS